jgi:poly(3-hydroxybutyrate) depolymerase
MKLSFKIILGLVVASRILSPIAVQASDLTNRKCQCDGVKYRYLLFAPTHDQLLPAILLLHGAGDLPDPMIDAWKKLAKKENIVLIAPELPRDLKFEAIAPGVFHCIVEDAKHAASIDPKRLYVFGNSMGGYLTYDAAMLDSQYYAAAAVHAMMISPEFDGIVEKATRKIPIAIYMGTQDQLVPLAGVRRTRNLLLKGKFSVHYVELKQHDHNYYDISDQINADAWNFLKTQQLTAN